MLGENQSGHLGGVGNIVVYWRHRLGMLQQGLLFHLYPTLFMFPYVDHRLERLPTNWIAVGHCRSLICQFIQERVAEASVFNNISMIGGYRM